MLSNTLISVLGLAASASAHVVMSEPKGWKVNNSPLLADGSDFPCKGVAYDSSVTANKMSKGAEQSMSFMGSAVHGGGSCQVSLTTDAKPTKDSVWKVIKSFEGGCPATDTDGNYAEDPDMVLPTKYGFEIPEDVPAGQYTLAWTWFNKVGNREMYMNCAPIEADGEGGSESAFQELPDMFVANIANGCHTEEGVDLQFPIVGKLVERLGLASSLKALSADDPESLNKGCEALKAGGSGGSKSPLDAITGPGGIFSPVEDSASSAGSEASTTSSTSAPSAPAYSAPAYSAPAEAKPTPAPAPSVPAYSAPAEAEPTSASAEAEPTSASAEAEPTSASAEAEPTSASAEAESTSASAEAEPTPAPAAPTDSAPAYDEGSAPSNQAAPAKGNQESVNTGGPTGHEAGQPCTSNGYWNCISGHSFQRCASGVWSAVQLLAEGTECSPGESELIEMLTKRGLTRFGAKFLL